MLNYTFDSCSLCQGAGFSNGALALIRFAAERSKVAVNFTRTIKQHHCCLCFPNVFIYVFIEKEIRGDFIWGKKTVLRSKSYCHLFFLFQKCIPQGFFCFVFFLHLSDKRDTTTGHHTFPVRREQVFARHIFMDIPLQLSSAPALLLFAQSLNPLSLPALTGTAATRLEDPLG